MKKLRYALLPVLLAASSFAEDSKVSKNEGKAPEVELKISGEASVHFGGTSNRFTYNNKDDHIRSKKDTSMPRICAGDAEVVFDAKVLMGNGYTFGSKIAMDAEKGDTGVDKMYVFVQKDNLGSLFAGNIKGPESVMLCSGQNLIGATTALDGTVPHDIDFATGIISPLYVVGATSKATKIVYYTPRFFGFLLGVAITPDTKHIGHDDKDWRTGDSSNGNDNGLFNKGLNDKERPSGRNNISVGLNHTYQINDDWTTKVSFIYVAESVRSVKTECRIDKYGKMDFRELSLRNTRAYHATASVRYKKLTIGTGYLNNGKSRLPDRKCYEGEFFTPGGFITDINGNAGYAWNVGAKYELDDKWTFGTVYHNATRKVNASEKTKLHALSFSVDYKVCPGFALFSEFTYVRGKSCETACKLYDSSQKANKSIKDQKSALFLVGMKMSF